jgi:acetyl-CoA carboxylase carboxyltransferase component
MRRSLLTLVGFAGGALAGTAAYRRVFGRSRERVDVYFDDGSFVTFGPNSREAARLLPLAHQVLATAGRG